MEARETVDSAMVAHLYCVTILGFGLNSTRFDLSQTFVEWKKRLFNDLDMVGVIYEAQRLHETHNFRMKLIHCLNDLPETMPAFLIINKIDLVKDKDKLVTASKRLLNEKKAPMIRSPEEGETGKCEEPPKKLSLTKRISKIFYISALENIGVGDLVSYLLEQAKEGEWMLPEGKHCDTSLHKLILNLTRAQFLDVLPHFLPYSLKFQVELLEGNDLGQIACVVLAKCKRDSDKAYLLSRKLNRVKEIARKLESDLYNVFQKDFRITIVVTDKKGKA